MARGVRNRQQFARAIRAIKRRPLRQRQTLLGFMLFDDRQSHRVVGEFARRQFRWLDTLASSAGMMLFLFMPPHTPPLVGSSGRVAPKVRPADRDEESKNPSLDIASQFGLTPRDLPGIVFFTELDLNKPGPHDGVYWPLRIGLFDQEQRDAENELARLFALVQSARARTTGPVELLASLRASVESEARKAQAGPLLDALRTGLVRLVTFPGRLLEAASVAFGQELGRQAARGGS